MKLSETIKKRSKAIEREKIPKVLIQLEIFIKLILYNNFNDGDYHVIYYIYFTT